VCAFLIVLNCDKSGIKCDKYGGNCDGIKGYLGHVSLFQPPTRQESGSAFQNSNLYKDGSDNAGKLFLLLSYFNVQIHDRFEHNFSSIRAKMAELEPIEKLGLLYTYKDSYKGSQGY
jgi:hypothetical protein